jgi:hypothetical protein
MAKLIELIRPSFRNVALCALATAHPLAAYADDFPKWDQAVTRYNERQVLDFHPKFDFDADGCYPATPFHPNEALRANPGTKATASLYGGCKDAQWRAYANTIHRQVCKASVESANRVERCAHFYELYFEKDQAIGLSFLGGHRHDVETMIVWTAKINGLNDSATHVSTSAHGKYTTRPISQVQMQGTHPLVVYHKDGVATHAFRFASADDRARVEFLGNWGEFYAPDIISHYSAAASLSGNESTRYGANRTYRLALEAANFGNASFKTRNDQALITEANSVVPRSDGFWQNTSFTIEDVWWTRDGEFKANYPHIYSQIRE